MKPPNGENSRASKSGKARRVTVRTCYVGGWEDFATVPVRFPRTIFGGIPYFLRFFIVTSHGWEERDMEKKCRHCWGISTSSIDSSQLQCCTSED